MLRVCMCFANDPRVKSREIFHKFNAASYDSSAELCARTRRAVGILKESGEAVVLLLGPLPGDRVAERGATTTTGWSELCGADERCSENP